MTIYFQCLVLTLGKFRALQGLNSHGSKPPLPVLSIKPRATRLFPVLLLHLEAAVDPSCTQHGGILPTAPPSLIPTPPSAVDCSYLVPSARPNFPALPSH